jgi:hypothetical protein
LRLIKDFASVISGVGSSIGLCAGGAQGSYANALVNSVHEIGEYDVLPYAFWGPVVPIYRPVIHLVNGVVLLARDLVVLDRDERDSPWAS